MTYTFSKSSVQRITDTVRRVDRLTNDKTRGDSTRRGTLGTGTGTSLYPILVGAHDHYDSTAQKIVYVGSYCTDFDGVTCTTWEDCYLVAIYNVTQEDYDADSTAWDFEDNTILQGEIVSYDFNPDPLPEGTTAIPTLLFTHDRWL